MPRALSIIEEARKCTRCAADLPLEPRPLLAGSAASRVLIIGQAPGLAAHESGTPWDDRSGDRLRDWLAVSSEQFYDPDRIALLPMGFCYPGTGSTGDLAPRPECAPEWHERIRSNLTSVEVTLFVGRFAFESYVSSEYRTLTEAVRAANELLPTRCVLPHPSPRNNRWLAKNPWFGRDVLPALKRRIAEVLKR